MPYSDPEVQRAYQRRWMAQRRAEWFVGKVCVDCGALEELELDHVDPALKVSHRIWSWSLQRRLEELAKCVVRCRVCHDKRDTGAFNPARGEEAGQAKLQNHEVVQIRQRLAAGEKAVDLAVEYGVSRQIIGHIKTGYRWSWLIHSPIA